MTGDWVGWREGGRNCGREGDWQAKTARAHREWSGVGAVIGELGGSGGGGLWGRGQGADRSCITPGSCLEQ